MEDVSPQPVVKVHTNAFNLMDSGSGIVDSAASWQTPTEIQKQYFKPTMISQCQRVDPQVLAASLSNEDANDIDVDQEIPQPADDSVQVKVSPFIAICVDTSF